jgi:hypothetical protein
LIFATNLVKIIPNLTFSSFQVQHPRRETDEREKPCSQNHGTAVWAPFLGGAMENQNGGAYPPNPV